MKDSAAQNCGDLAYSGDIVINGDVKQGISIKAGKSLTIFGNVEDRSLLQSEADLIINGGICGSKSEVICAGHFESAFVEHAKVYAAKSLTVSNHCYMAKLSTRGNLLVKGATGVSGGRAVVIGGSLNALGNVVCKSLGTDGTATEIVVGVDLRMLEQVQKLRAVEMTLMKTMVQVNTRVQNLTGGGDASRLAGLTASARTQMRDDLSELKNLRGQQEELSNKRRILELKMRAIDEKRCFLNVKEALYPLIKLRIFDCEQEFKELIRGNHTFRAGEDGEIIYV